MRPVAETIPIRPDGLQLQEHRTLQERIWSAQRVGWLFLAAIVAVAVGGGTGRGGVWAGWEISVGEASVILPRVTRRGATDEVRFAFAGESGPHEVTLGPEFLASFQITDISPEPDRAYSRAGAMVLIAGTEGPAPHQIILHTRAQRVGFPYISLESDGTVFEARTVILP